MTTRDDIIRLAEAAGFCHFVEWGLFIDDHDGACDAELMQFHALAVAAEREACIAVVKSVKTSFEAQDRIVLDAVQAIRARSNNP